MARVSWDLERQIASKSRCHTMSLADLGASRLVWAHRAKSNFEKWRLYEGDDSQVVLGDGALRLVVGCGGRNVGLGQSLAGRGDTEQVGGHCWDVFGGGQRPLAVRHETTSDGDYCCAKSGRRPRGQQLRG